MSNDKVKCINGDCPEGVYPIDQYCAFCGEQQFARRRRGLPSDAPNLTSERRIGDNKIPIVQEPPRSMVTSSGWAKPSQSLTVRLKGKLRRGKPSEVPDLTKSEKLYLR